MWRLFCSPIAPGPTAKTRRSARFGPPSTMPCAWLFRPIRSGTFDTSERHDFFLSCLFPRYNENLGIGANVNQHDNARDARKPWKRGVKDRSGILAATSDDREPKRGFSGV